MSTETTPGVVAATRIAAGDDRTRYDGFTRALHWLTVALVLTQFATSQLWDYFPRSTKHLMITGHMSSGILLAAVVLTRIVWRVAHKGQMPPAVSGWVEIASKAVHWLLYALLVSEATLGFVLRWSGGEALSFFGLPIGPPFSPFSKSAHHWVGEFHNWTGWTIIVLAAGHAGAALYHHVALHDDVLWRMLPGHRARREEVQAPSPERAAPRSG